MKRQQGFTLIELMITIAILGILMAIAVPAYLDYSIRARVSEGIRMTSGFKTAVEEYRQTEGTYPASANDLGVAGTIDSKYVTSVQVNKGKIVVDISETAVRAPATCNLQVVISPIDRIDNDVLTAVDWVCRPGTTANKCKQYLPSSCRKSS